MLLAEENIAKYNRIIISSSSSNSNITIIPHSRSATASEHPSLQNQYPEKFPKMCPAYSIWQMLMTHK